ncbi:MAG: hypothetical protein CTY19_06810 [Methylomonas sp.]|nr:MAG: hypothetical protein CTY19_06810 [Methylomonas sp.]
MKHTKSLIAVSLLLNFNLAIAQADVWTPFTVVEVTTDESLSPFDPSIVILPYERQVDSQFAQVGSNPGLFAKGRALFGETGSYAIATGQPSNVGAFAETSWSDAFTILGGTGNGILSVSVRVDGVLTGGGSVSSYRLFVSDTPITLGAEGLGGILGYDDNDNHLTNRGPDDSDIVIQAYGVSPDILAHLSQEELEILNQSPIIHSGSNLFTAEIPFTYGVTFYIASKLNAEVMGDGAADFFNSSHFGATTPDGLAVAGASGTVYQQAAVVPVPSAIWLFGSGVLGLMGFKRRNFVR